MKAYEESTGPNAIRLVRLMEEEFGDDEHLVIVTNPLDSMIAVTSQFPW